MKKLLLLILTSAFAQEHPPPQENLSYYVSTGLSTFFCIPYIGDLGAGMRYTESQTWFGLDGSLNYTTNGLCHNFFAKASFPLYLTPSKAKSSFYLGPYITGGQDFPRFVPSSGSLAEVEGGLEFETGLILGKNFAKEHKIASFVQLTVRGLALQHEIRYKEKAYVKGPYEWNLIAGLLRFDYGYVF